MALVQRLINPTPFNVKIPYEKGVYLSIPADGELDLTGPQAEDFRPGTPGYEAARKLLEFEGVFMQDSDFSYDFQALQALKMAVRAREERVNDFITRTKNARLSGGAAVDDASMEELVESAGYGAMRRGVERLKARVRSLEKVVSTDASKGSVRQNLDPKRTCFVINPPRQFPSVTALNMFLDENPEIKKQHEIFTGAAQEESDVGTEVSD